jgi:hypothetical protein
MRASGLARRWPRAVFFAVTSSRAAFSFIHYLAELWRRHVATPKLAHVFGLLHENLQCD